MASKRVVIMGAAGRDFHNFNVYYRGNAGYEVVAFTATQIPDIAGRAYPKELAGSLYPNGIPIYEEKDLPDLIKKFGVDDVVFSYSDVSHEHVMHCASIALAAGANFVLLGPKATMIKSTKPVVSVCAVRTGSGKSQTSRRVCEILRAKGRKVVAIRHPMPYGDLVKQAVERFANYADLDRFECTIEEREEYEPHIDSGTIVYAGVDYERILRQAEKEADVIVWDGGNNDLSFYSPNLSIVVADPHRAGHETFYHPGEANLRSADFVLINKVDSAPPGSVAVLEKNVRSANPSAKIIRARSKIVLENGGVKGKRVLVVEDGPTLTHGGMAYGAGFIAAERASALIIDARAFAVGSIQGVYEKYPQLQQPPAILPAMGYGAKQVKELEETINASDADLVVAGTPIDLRRVLKTRKPIVRARYELEELPAQSETTLEKVLEKF